jgi:diphthamide biosynthesis enzyme Dph1/Dph2-like protein
LVRASGRRAFTLVMGKLNVAKLANYADIDAFVLVASPENSLHDPRVRSTLVPGASLSLPLSLSLSD